MAPPDDPALASAKEVAVADDRPARNIARRIGEGGQRRPGEFLLDHDVDAHAVLVRLPIDIHVRKQPGGVQPLAYHVQRIRLQELADGDAGNGADGFLVGANRVLNPNVGDDLVHCPRLRGGQADRKRGETN